MRTFAILASLALFALVPACGDEDPEPGEFGADCSTDTDCNAPNVCFAFNEGKKCTIPCPANPDDCPEPSSGCNNMQPSYCKTK